MTVANKHFVFYRQWYIWLLVELTSSNVMPYYPWWAVIFHASVSLRVIIEEIQVNVDHLTAMWDNRHKEVKRQHPSYEMKDPMDHDNILQYFSGNHAPFDER